MFILNGQLCFWLVFVALSLIVIYSDRKYSCLRDISELTSNKPYSFSRVQLAWWSVIILAAFVSIAATRGKIPIFDSSTLILLGISSAATATARIIDISDQQNPGITRSQDCYGSQGFLIDILSDATGVSIHRLQAAVFNLIFGYWFIAAVVNNLTQFVPDINKIIPSIDQSGLILLGISTGTYAALKTTENKSKPAQSSSNGQPEFVPDEALGGTTKGQG